MSLKKYKEDFVLLLEAGFIAVNQADEDSSRKLFKAASLLDKKNTLPKVGIGYLHLHLLELNDAIRCFDEVLEKEPKNEMAKTFKGICMSFKPKDLGKGEKILSEASLSKDPLIKKLGATALDFVDKFVKQSPGPAERKSK